MELQKFAEHILFSPKLQDKLITSDSFTDLSRGRGIAIPENPTREAHIALKNSQKSMSFPTFYQLEKDLLARGHALHFFANHELLALELMALMLLRFPNAEPEFRMSLAYTMKEEQEHLKGYLACMEKMGVGFGEISLNNHFWKLFADVKSPIEFAAGMGLVFEQCNLDFSREYRDFFNTLGDTETGSLLNKVYLEEIGHVKNGLKWVQKWAPEQTQWQAFISNIRPPLGPHKAKGLIFDEEARRAVGFDDEFIQNMKIYNQSKGRTPHVYRFNVAIESELLLKTPSKIEQELTQDLELLQMHLAASDDLLWLHKEPYPKFLLELGDRGWSLPELRVDAPSFNMRKLGDFRPWGWTPMVQKEFDVFWDKANPKFRTHCQNCWSSSKESLYSKAYSQDLGRKFAKFFPENLCASPEIYGELVQSWSDVLTKLQNSQFQKWILKSNLSSSGQSQYRFENTELGLKLIQEFMAQKQNENPQATFCLEPLLEKVEDFSFLYWIEKDSVKLHGITRFFTTPTGRYIGTQVGRFDALLQKDVLQFLRKSIPGYSRDLLMQCAESLRQFLQNEKISDKHLGPLGVDVLVYKDLNSVSAFKIKPIVEINPRYTMGFIAHGLKKRISSASVGQFKIINKTEVRKSGGFAEWWKKYAQERPAQWDSGVLRSGRIALTDPQSAQSFLAVLDVQSFNELK